MNYKHSFLFVISFLIGLGLITQYQSYRHAAQELSRGSSLDYVNQVNLLVQDNDELKQETERLQGELENLASNADANSFLEQEISNLELLTGDVEVKGTGIEIVIDLPIEHYWLVDMINELYLAGAEGISLNSTRMTGREGFLSDSSGDEIEIYINNKRALNRPYTIQAIGDTDVLYNYLTEYNSVLRRLQASFVDSEELITIEKKDEIKIPSVL